MLTHANLYEAGRAGHEAGHVDGIDRSLSCLPLAHSYGLLVLNVALHHPGRQQSVLMRWFDPEAWLRLAQDHRVQIAPLVPSMLYLLLQQPLEDYDLSELRFVASGAAPLATGAIEEFIRRVPGVQIREGYGLTETSALVSTNPPGRCKHGTVGPAGSGNGGADRGRRGLRAFGARDDGLLERPGADRGDDPRRLAVHRRHGPPRRRRAT